MFGGLDWRESGDLTALVLGHVDVDWQWWHIKLGNLWPPSDRLVETAARDHAPYDQWAATGALELTPGAAIGYEFIAERLKDIFEDYDVVKIALDMWNWTHLKPWLLKAGLLRKHARHTFRPVRAGV